MIKFDLGSGDGEVWCPSCGTKNVEFVPDFKLIECPHFESLGSSLTMGEFDYDKNKIFAAAWSEITPTNDVMREKGDDYDATTHWLSILDEKLSEQYVFIQQTNERNNSGYYLYHFS